MMLNCIQRVRVSSQFLNYKFIHNTAVKGFTANEASMYNQGRPSYSDAALSKISELLLKIPIYDEKLQLVELGAGTGKFTNSFSDFAKRSKLQSKIGSYTAIEPSEGFRASLLASVSSSVKVTGGTGSKMALEDSSSDAVFAAQAFHWMANEDTLVEIHRVLKSKSPLVLIWNSYDYSSSKWLKVIDNEILTPNYGDVPRQQTGQWRDCFHTDKGIKLFFPSVKTWESRVDHTGTEQLIIDRIMSTSVIAEKNEVDKNAVRAHLKNIIDTHPDLAESRRTGVFTIPYVTELVWMYSRKESF